MRLPLFMKKNAFQVSPIVGFLTTTVMLAASIKGTKVVFGEPVADGCERIPAGPGPSPPPWDKEDRQRFFGQEASPVSDRTDCSSKHPAVPTWVKVGNTYEEHVPIPGGLFLHALAQMSEWDHREVNLSNGRTSRLRNEPPIDRSYLSQFLLRLDERLVRASLGVEPNHCFSLSIESLPNKI